MMRVLFAALILTVTMLPANSAFGVAVDEKPLADPAKEAIARTLMKEIRCLVCQNQSIEDSNADLAKDLRLLVRERIALGDTPAEVRSYLVDRYGDWVLLDPPFNQMTLFLWASPFLFLALVLYGVLTTRKKNTPAPLTTQEKEKIEQLITRGDKA